MNKFILDTNLFVLSHKEANDFYSVLTNREVPCICITDTNGILPSFLQYIEEDNILHVSFDDVEVWEQVFPHFYPIDNRVAKIIAQFIVDIENTPLVITCPGGVSRSAGIAAGIFDFLDNIEQCTKTVKTFPAYNKSCAKYIKDALGEIIEERTEGIYRYILSNPLFGKISEVREKKHPFTGISYIEVDTHTGKVAINYPRYLPGGWSWPYGHYMWQISYAFQECEEIHMGPFSCNLYPLTELNHMINDIEKEYVRRKRNEHDII